MKRHTIYRHLFCTIAEAAETLNTGTKEILMSARRGELQAWVDKADHLYTIRQRLRLNEEINPLTNIDSNGYPETVEFEDPALTDLSNFTATHDQTSYSLLHDHDLTKLINNPSTPIKVFQFQDPENPYRVFVPIDPIQIEAKDLLIRKKEVGEYGIPTTPQNIKESFITSMIKNNLLPPKIDQACFVYFSYFFGKQPHEEPQFKVFKNALEKNKVHKKQIQLALTKQFYNLCTTKGHSHNRALSASPSPNRVQNTMLYDPHKIPPSIKATIDIYYEFWSHLDERSAMKQPVNKQVIEYINHEYPDITGRQRNAVISLARPSHFPNKSPHIRRWPFRTRTKVSIDLFNQSHASEFGFHTDI